MITIEFLPDQQEKVATLANEHGDLIKQVKTRNSMGGGQDLTLLVSLAAVAIPAVKAALLEAIRSRRFKSFSYKGLKITGQSAQDIEKILTSLRDTGIQL